MLKHEIEPFLDDGRGGIPVEGVLQDDEVVFKQQGLFAVDIDQEIGIGGVEVVNGDALEIPDGSQHLHLDN